VINHRNGEFITLLGALKERLEEEARIREGLEDKLFREQEEKEEKERQ
jgi:hypothetical protein